jgi:hypothetical protein
VQNLEWLACIRTERNRQGRPIEKDLGTVARWADSSKRAVKFETTAT